LREAVMLIDTGGTGNDASGNGLAAAKAGQINTASPFGVNDVVQFTPDLFGPAQQQVVLEDGTLLLSRSVTITGPAASRLAVSGNNQSTVLEVAPGATVRISGLTVEAGAGSGNSGGGIDNRGTLTLTDAVVSGNTAVQGGGGIANTGTLTLAHTVVAGNTALSNAGIDNSGTLTLTDSTVSGNTALLGNGGLANYGGAMTLVDSTVSGNTAYGAGGLGNYLGGTATLIDSLVSGNAAANAAGIVNYSTMTLVDSTVSANKAGAWGGGILNFGTLTLTDSTVAGNAAPTDGGIANAGTLTLADTVVAGNTALSNAGIDNSGTLTLTDSTVSGNTALLGNGGDIVNTGTLTFANTAVPGNGGIDTFGALTLTDSTVAGNAAPTDGGVDNSGTLTPTDSGGLAWIDTTGTRPPTDSSASDTIGGTSGNTAAMSLDDGADPAGVNHNVSAQRAGLTPIDNLLFGHTATDRAVSGGSTGNDNRSAEATLRMPADGIVHTDMLTLGPCTPEGPAWESTASAVYSESKPRDDRAQRLAPSDCEVFLDPGSGLQAEWTPACLVGLLPPWFLNDEGPLEERSAPSQGFVERDEDRR
jgi:hypothetical protein